MGIAYFWRRVEKGSLLLREELGVKEESEASSRLEDDMDLENCAIDAKDDSRAEPASVEETVHAMLGKDTLSEGSRAPDNVQKLHRDQRTRQVNQICIDRLTLMLVYEPENLV